MNILHVFRDACLEGGSVNSLFTLIEYSGKDQHSIMNLCPVNDGSRNYLRARRIGSPIHAPCEFEDLAEWADIVHLHWWQDPVIHEFLNSDLPPMRLLIWAHVAGDTPPHIITPSLVSKSDVFVACNPYSYQLPVLASYDSGRVAMVYSVTDPEKLYVRRQERHDGITVGYVGSLNFKKLHPDFVQMHKSIDLDGMKFVVCGWGADAEALMGEADSRFEFRGRIDDIGKHMAEFDIFGYPLAPDAYAGSELVLQEAMLCGVAPVVLPAGGIRHLVHDGFNGRVARNPSEYVDIIEELARTPLQRQMLGENAQKYARQVFSPKISAWRMRNLYTSLCKQPKKLRATRGPMLSVIVSGRNDEYAGNFRERLLTCWKLNSTQLNDREISHEWIFVEWNPLDEDYLSYELAKLGFTCYVIDPAIHEEICTHPQMTFMQFFAKNVGIRRARTDWVLVTNPDCLLGPQAVHSMQWKQVQNNTIYRAERRDLPFEYFESAPSELFAQSVAVHDSWMGVKFTEAAGDFVLFDKTAVTFGYDEQITFSDVGTDGRFLENWVAQGGQIEFLGSVFKADHDELFHKHRETDSHKGRSGWNYRDKIPYTMAENWGLADCEEEEIAENVWYIRRRAVR
jgi:glycosyltransferase involved in cell wall biosynthesis